MHSIKSKYLKTYFLTEFKVLKEDKIIKSFLIFLDRFINSNSFEENIQTYSNFVSNLNSQNKKNFSLYIKEKIFIKKNLSDKNQAQKELKILSDIASIDFNTVKEALCKKFKDRAELLEYLAFYETEKSSINIDDIKEESLDIFENSRAFIFDNDFEIKPIELKENLRFNDLKGYVEQKRILYDNTKSLLSGLKVNNILLYGDAGCGKSSSVRALLGEFKELKIVQIFKNNLINLDKLYEKLKNSNHKFIIFADDISFDEQDPTLSTMKAVLEGSLIECPKNAAIYATSNRRHLIKESFQSRCGDEIHLNDTINEISSLSERFGINILFAKPTNDEFNDIVIQLAKDNNIQIEEKLLIEKAQRLALIKGSKSPRIIRQLIDNLLAHIDV